MLRTKLPFLRPRKIVVYTDGAIRPKRGISGLGVIVKNGNGEILHWWSKRDGPLTNNEAEYAAVIFALERLRRIYVGEVDLYTDSLILVDQMRGRAATRAPGLRKAHAKTRALVTVYKRVRFHHIPRRRNRLADALANDAVDGFSERM